MDPGVVDAAVRERLGAGDAAGAAEAIVRGLGPAVLGYVAAVLRDEDAAREVFAEVASQLVTSIAAFRGDSSVKTWTYRIAWRAAMRWREDPYRRRGRPLGSDDASGLAAAVRDSTAAYRRTGARDWLARARDALSPEDQSLLTLRLDRGLSWREIAEVMGDAAPGDEARLRKRFERIKARLRAAAERDGLLGD